MLADTDQTTVRRLAIGVHIAQCWIIETVPFLEAHNAIAAESLVALARIVRSISILVTEADKCKSEKSVRSDRLAILTRREHNWH